VNATYYCNGIEYPAAVRLDKKYLAIVIRREQDNGEVFWAYDKIAQRDAPRSFTYNDYPPQTLEVLESALANALQDTITQQKRFSRGRRFGPLAKLAVIIILVFTVLYVALVPWLAGALASRFPVSYEQKLGDQVFASMKNDFTIDQPATAAINRFFNALDIPSKYPVNITVVKGDVTNAFALPGGHIVVYDKLLQGIGSYEELAALLSHEFIHVQNRHTVRGMFRQLGSAIFLSLLIGDLGAVSAVVLNNANEIKNLSYSRSLESEADEEGARLLAQRNISCTGFVRLFQLLEKQSEGQMQPTEWMSSHPDLRKRIRQIKANKACTEANAVKDEKLYGLFLRLKTAE
jgi:Zn-dependent protease with chaperone function